MTLSHFVRRFADGVTVSEALLSLHDETLKKGNGW
jgi:hypothetical protein